MVVTLKEKKKRCLETKSCIAVLSVTSLELCLAGKCAVQKKSAMFGIWFPNVSGFSRLGILFTTESLTTKYLHTTCIEILKLVFYSQTLNSLSYFEKTSRLPTPSKSPLRPRLSEPFAHTDEILSVPILSVGSTRLPVTQIGVNFPMHIKMIRWFLKRIPW